MAEIRCPMCSKPNPEDAETCTFCGARLKPLVAGPPDEGSTPEIPPGEGQEGPVPDWLARVRSRAEADREDEDELGELEPDDQEGGSPDWLGRLRQAEPFQEEGPPEGFIPDWLEEESDADLPPSSAEPPATPPSSDRPETGWLDRLRAESDIDDEPEAPEGQAEAAEDQGEAPSEPDVVEPEEDDELDWLSDLGKPREETAGSDDDSPGMAAEGVSPWAEFETPSELPDDAPEEDSGPSEDWLEDLSGGGTGELPDWISELGEPGDEPAEGELDLSGLEDVGEMGAAEMAESGPSPDEGIAGAPELEQEPAEASPQEPSGPTDEDREPTDAFDWDEVEFDWDSEEAPPEAVEETGEEDTGEGELPHVPALIMGEPGEEPAGDVQDFDLSTVDLPDWLSEVRPDAGDGEGGRGDLAPATIPNWLEAMRPVETFRPVVDVEPEEEQAVESVGPLAGLRGVLLAEPVVAKPRSSTTSGARLEVTERQFAQAELLQRIVEQEEHEVPAPVAGKRAWPVARWLVSIVMLLAVLMPATVGAPVFPVPQRVSRDLGPLVGIVNTLPTDRPVLMVFDFEPGYSGELDAVAAPLIENLLARGINIVTVSTRPTGPPLAVDLIGQIGAPYQIENGRNVLHLGYLSGGPSAVQLFAAAPREAILKGFELPPEMEGQSAWASPLLSDVHSLSDFGMVAVVAAGTDTARTWAEQAHPWLGETPLVMVLSQGAEPMIRPYFESLTPQVNGILSGLPTALAYEGLNGRHGMAYDRWNGFGAGAFAAEWLIFAGVIYGVVVWVVRRRRA
jgi:hypothetical protein